VLTISPNRILRGAPFKERFLSTIFTTLARVWGTYFRVGRKTSGSRGMSGSRRVKRRL